MKSAEVGELREQTLGENARARWPRRRSTCARASTPAGACSRCGNGGSATDAMDLVGRTSAHPRRAAADGRSRRAIDLTEDPSILTAIANDIGVEEIFQRQVIAYGRERRRAAVLSTSGNSENLIVALAEARRARAGDGRDWSATTAAGSPPRGSPTT